MRFEKRRGVIGYTATSMAIVLGIAAGAMYFTDKRVEAARESIPTAESSRTEPGMGGSPAAGGESESGAARMGDGEAVPANGAYGQAAEASRFGSAGGGANAPVGAVAGHTEGDVRSAAAPLVEGSEAERGSAKGVAFRSPERAPERPGRATEPRPTPRSIGDGRLAAEGPHRAVLPALAAAEIERLELAAKLPGPLEVGPVRAVEATPPLLELAGADSGRRLRAFSLRSEGAASMRLHFSRFDVGDAEVLVYAETPEGQTVLGPFTGRGPSGQGEFWTGPLRGDEAVVEISGGNGVVVELDQALHAQLGAGAEQAAKSGDGLLTCHEDVTCHSVDQIARDAVGQLSYMEDGAGWVCTGTLLADQDDETVVPYLLTAYHCIGTQAVANTLNVTWLYQSSSCGAAAPDWASSPMSPNGADIVKTNTDNDMTLLRLRDPIPAGVGLAGWTTNTGVSGAHGIHHPWGSHKRYTDLNAVGFCPNCLCKDPTDYDFYDMQEGFTQGGSSGSAVFDGQGRIAGQLWGSCSKGLSHPDDMTCGTTHDYWAVYGEFQTTHGKIKRWLEIGGTIRVDASAGSGGQGTPSNPFGQIAAAEAFAWDGSRIKLAPGTYSAAVQLDKAVTLMADGGVVTIGQ